MSKPYYRDDYVTVLHGDCREIVPGLGRFDLLLCDPPYGIGQDRGRNIGGNGICTRNPKRYAGTRDRERQVDGLLLGLGAANTCIVWGGNYYSDVLTQRAKWLVWDKCQTMPTYSDAELAWTTLDGVSVKMLRYSGNGLLAVEKERYHPTQKPLALMTWCIGLADQNNGKMQVMTILDPFAGSGATAVSAKNLGRKCVCVEREERYCEIIAKRCSQEVLNFGAVKFPANNP